MEKYTEEFIANELYYVNCEIESLQYTLEYFIEEHDYIEHINKDYAEYLKKLLSLVNKFYFTED